MSVKQTEEAIKVLIANGYIRHFWHEDDIQYQAVQDIDRELTEDEISEVKSLLERQTDCNVGINWEVISKWIDYVLNEKD